MDYLHTLKLKKGETIQTFVNPFNVVTLEIYNLDQSVAMLALEKGLLVNNLKKSLAKTYPKNFAEMLA